MAAATATAVAAAAADSAEAAAAAAAKQYADAVIGRRDALLRQLSLHVQAFMREEGKGVSSAPATARPTPTDTSRAGVLAAANRGRRVTAPVTPSPLQASLTRLVQQLRRETVRVVEAVLALQRAAPAPSTPAAGFAPPPSGGGSGGSGGDTGGSPPSAGGVRAASSTGSAASRLLDPKPYDDVLARMLHDTDMITMSSSLCAALGLESTAGRANPLLQKASLLAGRAPAPPSLPPVLAWLADKLAAYDMRDCLPGSGSGSGGADAAHAAARRPAVPPKAASKLPLPVDGDDAALVPRHLLGTVLASADALTASLASLLAPDATVLPEGRRAAHDRQMAAYDAELLLRQRAVYLLVEHVRLVHAQHALADAMSRKLAEERARKAASERVTRGAAAYLAAANASTAAGGATFLTAAASPPTTAPPSPDAGARFRSAPPPPAVIVDADGEPQISREWMAVVAASEASAVALGIVPVATVPATAVGAGGGSRSGSRGVSGSTRGRTPASRGSGVNTFTASIYGGLPSRGSSAAPAGGNNRQAQSLPPTGAGAGVGVGGGTRKVAVQAAGLRAHAAAAGPGGRAAAAGGGGVTLPPLRGSGPAVSGGGAARTTAPAGLLAAAAAAGSATARTHRSGAAPLAAAASHMVAAAAASRTGRWSTVGTGGAAGRPPLAAGRQARSVGAATASAAPAPRRVGGGVPSTAPPAPTGARAVAGAGAGATAGRGGLRDPKGRAGALRSPARTRDMTLSSSPTQTSRIALAHSPYATIVSPKRAAGVVRTTLSAGMGGAMERSAPAAPLPPVAEVAAGGGGDARPPPTAAAAREAALAQRVNAAAASASAILTASFGYIPSASATGLGTQGSPAGRGSSASPAAAATATGGGGGGGGWNAAHHASLASMPSYLGGPDDPLAGMPSPRTATLSFVDAPPLRVPFSLPPSRSGPGLVPAAAGATRPALTAPAGATLPTLTPSNAAALNTSVSDFMSRLETIKASIFQRMGIRGTDSYGDGDPAGMGAQ